ncbi:MAG: hypothetical protein FJX47_08970 [Alphaproteobacteria bacterium]|nr:hypothetical protein [Alphaproteobacteria bacterium]
MLSALLRQVGDPKTGAILPRKLGRALHIEAGTLARLARVHRNTFRSPTSARVQARLGEIVRILARATELCGDRGQAVLWFRHQPLTGFDGDTAEALVAKGQGAAVLKHLDILADGLHA